RRCWPRLRAEQGFDRAADSASPVDGALMASVASGNLRDRVQLQKPDVDQDPNTGEMVTTWPTVATAWADMHYQSVREFVAASAEQSEVRGHAMIRYRSDVDATWRVVYRGKYFRILGVMPDNESGREHLTLALA